MKIKILHLLSSNMFSGAENMATQIISMFRDVENFEMIYCCPKGPIEDVLKRSKIKYVLIENFTLKEIRKIIKSYNPTIIHAHDVKASVKAACISDNIPIISHIHGNHENMRKINFKTLAFQMFNKKFSYIYWVSKSALDQYRFMKNIKHKSSILYNVVNSEKILKLTNEDINSYKYDVIFLGRLEYPKNPQRLIRIIEKLKCFHPGVSVAIVGDGMLKKELEELVSKLGLVNNIEFMGYLKNPYKVLLNSKVMLMTSRYEGTPMCVLESLVLGVPVVSTPTDGVKEIIESGVNGFLSEEDHAIVSKLLEVITNRDLRCNLKQNSVKIANEHNDISRYRLILEYKYLDVLK